VFCRQSVVLSEQLNHADYALDYDQRLIDSKAPKELTAVGVLISWDI